MQFDEAFPGLTDNNSRITSPSDVRYNCIAWSAGESDRWWQPGVFWPVAVVRDECGIGALEQAFRELGYEDCESDELEPGFEKVALYGAGLLYTHAARQLPSGCWTSKLGKEEDIEHDNAHCVAGGVYGEVVQFMKRRVAESSPDDDQE